LTYRQSRPEHETSRPGSGPGGQTNGQGNPTRDPRRCQSRSKKHPAKRSKRATGQQIMSNTNRIVLVSGATGQQGGAVARHLLQNDFQVRALTRSPDKPAARALADEGAQLVEGNLDDRAS